MSSEDEEEEGQAQEEGRFDPRKQLNHVETNATLEDIERAKRRSKMVRNTFSGDEEFLANFDEKGVRDRSFLAPVILAMSHKHLISQSHN